MLINFENIPVYGLFILISLFVNSIIIFFLAKAQKINKNVVLCSLTYELIGIITGAKILNMIQIKENNSFYYAGFSSYGGVIGGIFSLVIFSRLYKIPLKKLLNIYVPLLPLLYSISKIGCFFAGCCYGIEYDGIGCVIYEYSKDAPLNIKLFPVQIIETIVNFIIFIFILFIYKKNKDNLKIVGFVFILCGISKFLLEFLRFSWNGFITSTQIISIIFIIIGIFINMKGRKNEEK